MLGVINAHKINKFTLVIKENQKKKLQKIKNQQKHKKIPIKIKIKITTFNNSYVMFITKINQRKAKA